MANKKTILVEAKKEEIESDPIFSSEPKITKTKERKNKKEKEKTAKAVKGMLYFFPYF